MAESKSLEEPASVPDVVPVPDTEDFAPETGYSRIVRVMKTYHVSVGADPLADDDVILQAALDGLGSIQPASVDAVIMPKGSQL